MENGDIFGFGFLEKYINSIKIPYDIAQLILDRFSNRNKVSCRLSTNPCGFGYILTMNYKGNCVNAFIHQPIERIYLKELLNKIYKHLLKSNQPSNG